MEETADCRGEQLVGEELAFQHEKTTDCDPHQLVGEEVHWQHEETADGYDEQLASAEVDWQQEELADCYGEEIVGEELAWQHEETVDYCAEQLVGEEVALQHDDLWFEDGKSQSDQAGPWDCVEEVAHDADACIPHDGLATSRVDQEIADEDMAGEAAPHQSEDWVEDDWWDIPKAVAEASIATQSKGVNPFSKRLIAASVREENRTRSKKKTDDQPNPSKVKKQEKAPKAKAAKTTKAAKAPKPEKETKPKKEAKPKKTGVKKDDAIKTPSPKAKKQTGEYTPEKYKKAKAIFIAEFKSGTLKCSNKVDLKKAAEESWKKSDAFQSVLEGMSESERARRRFI